MALLAGILSSFLVYVLLYTPDKIKKRKTARAKKGVFIEVYLTKNRFEASHLEAILKSEGIDAIIVNEFGYILSYADPAAGIQVMVHKDQADKAVEIVEAFGYEPTLFEPDSYIKNNKA